MRSFPLPRRVCPLAQCATLTIVLSLFVVPTADAQTTARKAQVGVLGVTPGIPANQEMFKQGLAQLGYTEGQQVAFVQQDAGGEPARLAAAGPSPSGASPTWSSREVRPRVPARCGQPR